MMAGFGMIEALILVLTMGGGGNDLLDYLDTRAYWKLKGIEVTVENMTRELAEVQSREVARLIRNLGADDFKTREEATRKLRSIGAPALPALRQAAQSDDPEVRTRARDILKTVSAAARARAIRRLMAIRALGELANKEALPHLRRLLASNEPFVADYGRAAIAKIEGTPYTRPLPKPTDLASDVCLLPPRCGVVAQVVLPPGAPLDWANFIARVPAGMAPDLATVQQQLATALTTLVERVGNIRLQAVTLGVSEDVGENSGFVVAIARGIYDREAVTAALRQQQVQERKADGLVVFAPEDQIALIPCGGGRFVVMAGPRPETLPIAEVAARLKHPRQKPAFDEKLLGQVMAKGGPIWAVMKVGKNYRQAPVFAPFDHLVLTSRRDKDGLLTLEIVAEGKKPEAVAGAVAMVKNGLKELQDDFAEGIDEFPPAKTFLDALKSVRVEARGPRATLTVKVNNAPLMLFSPFLFFSLGKAAAPPPPPAAMQPPPMPR